MKWSLKKTGLYKTGRKKCLDKATVLLEKIEREGLFTALEKGIFADIKRPKNGGEKDWTAFVPRERTIAILL